MTYRLDWLNHWSTRRNPIDPRVIVKWVEEADGWWEHQYHYYFTADNDEEAKVKAIKYMEQSHDEIDIFSLLNRATKTVILTEEEL